jgi:hypothetical protein
LIRKEAAGYFLHQQNGGLQTELSLGEEKQVTSGHLR